MGCKGRVVLVRACWRYASPIALPVLFKLMSMSHDVDKKPQLLSSATRCKGFVGGWSSAPNCCNAEGVSQHMALHDGLDVGVQHPAGS